MKISKRHTTCKRTARVSTTAGAVAGILATTLIVAMQSALAADGPPKVAAPKAAPGGGAKPKADATEKARPGGEKPKPDSDEKVIRASADQFAKAFNAGDAKALGALWADDAEYTDESGKTLQGRDAIEQEYATLFKDRPGATIALTIESVRFPAPDVAIEKGVAKVKVPSARGESASRYTVVHVNRDSRWTMSVGRDDPYVPTSNEDYLQNLAWLIGDWAPEGVDGGSQIKCEWMAQRNFIRSTITKIDHNKSELTSVQVIGWNPKLHTIVSWHFDASGGFGDDVWSQDGAKWVIEATGVARDGGESSSVNVLTPIDADSFSWQSLRRTLDGTPLPDTALIKMVRVPANKPALNLRTPAVPKS